MNRYLFLALGLSTALTLPSCSTGITLLNAGGDVMTVTMQSNISYTGELLAVEDTALACMLDQGSIGGMQTKQGPKRFVRLPYQQIDRLVIEGYSNRAWILPVVLFEVVPGILFAAEVATNAHAVSEPIIALTAIPLTITIAGFAATTPPKPAAEQPFTPDVRRELQKYARFPRGLTSTQWEEFLKAPK